MENLVTELDAKIIELQEHTETNQITLDSTRTTLENFTKQKLQKEQDIKIIKDNAAILAEKYASERTALEENDEVLQGKLKDIEEENNYLKKVGIIGIRITFSSICFQIYLFSWPLCFNIF